MQQLDKNPQTLQEMSRYFECLQQGKHSDDRHLIALLVEETCCVENDQVDRLHNLLSPSTPIDDLKTRIASELKSVAQRVFYGFTHDSIDYGLYVWEAHSEHLKHFAHCYEQRRKDRREAFDQIHAQFLALSDMDKQQFLDGQLTLSSNSYSVSSSCSFTKTGKKRVNKTPAKRPKKQKTTPKPKAKDQPTLNAFVVRKVIKKDSQASLSEFQRMFPPFHVKENVTMAKQHPAASLELPAPVENFATLKSQFYQAANSNKYKAPAKRLGPIDLVSNQPWKHLQFCEDVRPPFGGIINKSSVLNGRNPWKKDTALDYEYDSEAEWEDEGPGEDIGSEDEDDEEEEEEEKELEDGWLVPHGYLSDDEREDDDETSKVELTSASVTQTQGQSNQQKRKPLDPLVPILVNPGMAYNFDNYQVVFITAMYDPVEGIDPFFRIEKSKVTKGFPDELEAELIALIQVSDAKISKLVDEFKEKHNDLTKACIENKIRDIAVRERRGDSTKWWIKEIGTEEDGFNEAPEKQMDMSTPKLMRTKSVQDHPQQFLQLISGPRFSPGILDQFQIAWLLDIAGAYVSPECKIAALKLLGDCMSAVDQQVQDGIIKPQEHVMFTKYNTLIESKFIDLIDRHIMYDPDNNITYKVVSAAVYSFD